MLEIIVVVLIYLVLCAASWAIVVGFLKLLGLCFGFSVSLAVATGIWLVIFFTEALMGADLILIPTVNTKAEPSEIFLVLFLIKLVFGKVRK